MELIIIIITQKIIADKSRDKIWNILVRKRTWSIVVIFNSFSLRLLLQWFMLDSLCNSWNNTFVNEHCVKLMLMNLHYYSLQRFFHTNRFWIILAILLIIFCLILLLNLRIPSMLVYWIRKRTYRYKQLSSFWNYRKLTRVFSLTL